MSTSSCGTGCGCSSCAESIALTSLGTPGLQGLPGQTPSIIIGTVTTGSAAAASIPLIQASPPVYQLNLTLPVGTTQVITTPQTFNSTVTINGNLTSNGTNTFTGSTTFSAATSVAFNGNVFFGGIQQASTSDCIAFRAVVTSTGQLKGIVGDGATTYIGTGSTLVTKAFDSTTDSAFGPVVNFSTACETQAKILVQVYLLNPGTSGGNPTALSLYTLKLYDSATLIGVSQCSNYQGGDILPFTVTLAAGNHSLNLAIAGLNIGDTGGQLSVTASTIRVDV